MSIRRVTAKEYFDDPDPYIKLTLAVLAEVLEYKDGSENDDWYTTELNIWNCTVCGKHFFTIPNDDEKTGYPTECPYCIVLESTMSYTIGYAGAQSSGKTTMVNRLARLFEDTGITYVLIPETARACPFPIGRDGGFRSEMWILKKQLQREAEAHASMKINFKKSFNNYIICDRVVYDCAVYSRSLQREGKMTLEELAEIESLIDDYSKTNPYDIIYLCEPKPIYADGKRDVDPKWQDEIFTEYKRYIKEKGLIFTMILLESHGQNNNSSY